MDKHGKTKHSQQPMKGLRLFMRIVFCNRIGFTSINWKENQTAALERRVEYQARCSGGINTWSHIRFCPNLEPFPDGRRAQRLLFNFGIYVHSHLST